MMKNNTFLLIFLLVVLLINKVSAQREKVLFINKHSVGLSILPIAETIIYKKATALSGIYSYNISKVVSCITAVSYYKKGEDSYSAIIGGGGWNFQIKGAQIKVALQVITNDKIISNKACYNFVGFGAALSSYYIHHEVALNDALGNTNYFPRTLNFYTKSFDIQWGKIIKIDNNFYLTTYVNVGLINSFNVDGIPINKLPAIGYIGSNSGLFINGNIELFYNIGK